MHGGHRTLPIAQVDPPATESAANIPGLGPVPSPAPSVRKMTRKPAFRTPVFSRVQSERGNEYGMAIKGENSLAPNVPLPVRSSLAQEIAVYRVQLSHYFASIAGATRFPGMAPGYPVAKVLTLVNTAPRMVRGSRAVRGQRGYPARTGYMNAPPRFQKALPSPINNYQPPVYGE